MRESRLVGLRPVHSADYDFVYSIAADPSAGVTWRFRGMTPAPEVFSRQLWEGVAAQYIVFRRRDSRPLGIVGLYNANFQAGFAACFAAAAPDIVGSGLVTLGAALLVDHAFALWSLRKVYFEVPEYNLPRLRTLTQYTTEEGRLLAHEYLWGRHWDQVVLALYRPRWQEIADRMLGRSDSR